MKYQRRALDVEAVQWTARNLDEIRTICPNAYTIESGWTLAIPIPQERQIVGVPNFLAAHIGYYIVRFPNGTILPMTADLFEANYESAS